MDTTLIRKLREDVTSIGVRELRTPEEVDTTIHGAGGTMLVFVNSVCRCSAGMARPGLTRALEHPIRPDHRVSVFAGQDFVVRHTTDYSYQKFMKNSPNT